jgi:phospholipid/cholesterol/gamma-HCH transport system substrate-binding protein
MAMAIARRIFPDYDNAEIITGLIVSVVAIVLLFAFYTSTRGAGVTGYEVRAQLPRADGLSVGSDVRIAGIEVGKVSGVDLNSTNYIATVHMKIKNSVRLPVDSSINCPGDFVSGSVHLDIVPGRNKSLIRPGDVITKAQGCSADQMSTAGKALGSQ